MISLVILSLVGASRRGRVLVFIGVTRRRLLLRWCPIGSLLVVKLIWRSPLLFRRVPSRMLNSRTLLRMRLVLILRFIVMSRRRMSLLRRLRFGCLRFVLSCRVACRSRMFLVVSCLLRRCWSRRRVVLVRKRVSRQVPRLIRGLSVVVRSVCRVRLCSSLVLFPCCRLPFSGSLMVRSRVILIPLELRLVVCQFLLIFVVVIRVFCLRLRRSRLVPRR